MTSFFVSAVTAKTLRISDHIGLMPAETQLRRLSVKFNGLELRLLWQRRVWRRSYGQAGQTIFRHMADLAEISQIVRLRPLSSKSWNFRLATPAHQQPSA